MSRKSISPRSAGRKSISSKSSIIGEKFIHQSSPSPSKHHTVKHTSSGLDFYEESKQGTMLPRIDLNFPQNVIGWTYLRLTIQNFGDRFRLRTDVYTGSLIVTLFVIMAFMITEIVTAGAKEDVFHSCFIVQGLIFICLLYVFLIALAMAGAFANYQLSLHGRTLTSHALRIRNLIQDLKTQYYQHLNHLHNIHPEEHTSTIESAQTAVKESYEEEIDLLNEVAEGIHAAMEIVQMNNELRPVRIFGFAANASVVFSIITSFISYLFVLASLYSSSIAQTGGAI